MIANVLGILFIVIVAFSPSNALRFILGAPFLLFLPGYTLIVALFPRRDTLSGVERVVLSFGFSIAIVSIIGLILNYTPWGIKVYPVIIAFFIFIAATSIVGWSRQRRLPENDRFAIFVNLNLPLWLGRSFIDKLLSIILIVAILGTIGTLGYAISKPKVGERFTEFYVVDLNEKAVDYPRELRVGETGRVILGIINREHEVVSYSVEVRISGIKNNEIGNIVLEHDAKWEAAIDFTPDRLGNSQKVEFLLYQHNNEVREVYSELHFWINVAGRQ